MAKILLVEDDRISAEFVRTWLTAERHVVELAYDGEEALEYLRIAEFDVILLDIDLPKVSGVEVLKQFRQSGKSTSVIMLTGKTAVTVKEDSLDGGADDYLTKPFEAAELSARIRVQLRKQVNSVSNELSVGGIVLNPQQMKVTKGGVNVELVPKEFSLLEFFMRNPDRVFSAETIMTRLWNLDTESGTNAFRTTLTRLRHKLKLDDNDTLIETIHGAGYRLNSGKGN
ncbi:MAG: response regulator transcription factor [Candidatus Melainabacteria bacterium]|nr:response regulator transcription factor [Candidatus Melainabacteria bacterium]